MFILFSDGSAGATEYCVGTMRALLGLFGCPILITEH